MAVEQLGNRQNGTVKTPLPAPRHTDHLESRRAHRPFLWKLTIFITVAVVAVALIHAFVLEPFTVPGNAMAPTLRAGDRVLVVKSTLLQGSIHSGEIVVFRTPKHLQCSVSGARSGDLVLRVVATPGQVISSNAHTVFVNGRPLDEHGWYDPSYGAIGLTPIHRTSLGSNQYFVMADDRADGCDSRSFGPIDRSSIVGTAFAVVARNGHLSVGGV